MDKCREEFQKAFPIPAHWIEFDEKSKRYYCPYVADAKAHEYQAQWVVWQHQQAKVEELEKEWLEVNQELEKEIQVGFEVNKENRELQKRVDTATKQAQNALQYVEGDMRGNHEFLQMAMIRVFKELEKVLNGGEPK